MERGLRPADAESAAVLDAVARIMDVLSRHGRGTIVGAPARAVAEALGLPTAGALFVAAVVSEYREERGRRFASLAVRAYYATGVMIDVHATASLERAGGAAVARLSASVRRFGLVLLTQP